MSDFERAASALHYIDPGCPREDWIRAGMAAQSAGLGFDEFHAWSVNGDNYKSESNCMTVWRSFKADKGVSAASLFQMAFMHAWQDPAKKLHAPNGARPGTHAGEATKAPVTPIKRAESLKAIEIWDRCKVAPASHPYMARKGGIPDGLRMYPLEAPPLIIQGQNVAGWLAVPCWSNSKLQTLQMIPDSGPKLNLPGASFNDGFFTVGEISESSRILVCEGVGQAWACYAATDDPAVVCFGAGRMATVANLLRTQHPAARIIVVPDRAKENQAEAIAATVNCEWCEMPSDKPDNYDANDYALEFGPDELADLLQRTKTPPMRFKLLSGVDLSNAPPMRWMVRGVLPLEGLAALYGPSGSGKSFLVLDVAASVAGGAYDWFGRRVAPCSVTYCALEGEAGMGKRVSAWSLHHKKSVPDCLRFITQPFDLLNGGDVAELAKAVQVAGGAGGLVILDTLNRAAPGADENSSVDMGNIIAAAKRLQTLTGGLVLLVHHTGKDATKGLRGHSSLYAALDGAIEVNKTDSRREWSVAKSKDDETGSLHPFRLKIVTVGTDDEGEEITSCVAVPDLLMDGALRRILPPKSGNQKIIWEALGHVLKQSTCFGKAGAPVGRPCVTLDEAIQQTRDRLVCDPKRQTERTQAAISGLVARGLLEHREGWLWIS